MWVQIWYRKLYREVKHNRALGLDDLRKYTTQLLSLNERDGFNICKISMVHFSNIQISMAESTLVTQFEITKVCTFTSRRLEAKLCGR